MKPRHIFVLIAMCGLAAASIGVTINTAGVFYAPIAEDLASRVLTLPTYYGLPLEDVKAIAENVMEIAG